MNKFGCLLAGALLACATDATPPAVDEQLAKDLVGSWVARLSLSEPYSLGPRTPDGQSICGTFGFVADHGTALENASAREAAVIGVYDLDLQHLGLNWLDDKSVPTASAIVRRNSTLERGSEDSIRIVIKTGPDERITLLGRYGSSGIDGEWTAQSARGAASGTFSMRRLGFAGTGCVAP